jgi:hypothetical protein
MTKAILVEAVKRRSAVQKLTVAFSGKCGLGQLVMMRRNTAGALWQVPAGSWRSRSGRSRYEP